MLYFRNGALVPINFKEAILFIWFYNGLSNRCSFSRPLGKRTGLSFFERSS